MNVIATGDGFGLSGVDALWGGTYSMGVLKSTDGGTSWNSTGLNWNITQSRQIHRLVLHPALPKGKGEGAQPKRLLLKSNLLFS